MSKTDARTGKAKTLQEFDVELEKLHIRGQWQYEALLESVIGGPKPAGVPYIWKWDVVHEKLLEACEVMPESRTARRNFSFFNPGLERGGTTQTLLMGMQMVMPGEIAWAHRHTIGALRFAVEGGADLYTVVNGERLAMEPNDLVLTPNWAWHDHHNETDAHAVWLDVLDVPLVVGLNQTFYEPFGEDVQPRHQNPSDDISARGTLLRPAFERRPARNFPFRYPWREVGRTLETMRALDATPDGIVLEYVNPMTGGPILPTLGAWIQLLNPGFEGARHRRSASAIYYVVEGEGVTIAGDQEIHWGPRDAFVVPNWTWHSHCNASKGDRAVLFSVNDIPLLEPLGLYREDPEITWRSPPPPAARAVPRRDS